jgi:Bromodomain
VSRLLQLESAFSQPDTDVDVEAFYAGSNDEAEDTEYVSFLGHVVKVSSAMEANNSHPSLSGSGMGSLDIVWDQGTDKETDQVSPWNVSVLTPNAQIEAPERPRLSENEKRRVRDALNTIGNLPGADQFFLFPVDLSKYSDYTSRVEVPMDLSFMKNRLDADYYATRYSAVADVRLIYLNCKKYNGDSDELSILASSMLEKFEEFVLDEQERVIFRQYDTPLSGPPLSDNHDAPAAEGAASAVRRRPQRGAAARSALETLPGSAESVRERSSRRRSQSSRSERTMQRSIRIATAIGRSVLARTERVQTLEQLSSGRAQRGRNERSAARSAASLNASHRNLRSTNTSAGQIASRARLTGTRNSNFIHFTDQEPAHASARSRRNHRDRDASDRAMRADRRNTSYMEVPSDADESLPNANPSRSDTSGSTRHNQRRNQDERYQSIRAGLRNSSTETETPGPATRNHRSITLRMAPRLNRQQEDRNRYAQSRSAPAAATGLQARGATRPDNDSEIYPGARRQTRQSHQLDDFSSNEVGLGSGRTRNLSRSVASTEVTTVEAQGKSQRISPRQNAQSKQQDNEKLSNGSMQEDVDSTHESEDPHVDDSSESSAIVHESSVDSEDNESLQSDDSSHKQPSTKTRSRRRASALNEPQTNNLSSKAKRVARHTRKSSGSEDSESSKSDDSSRWRGARKARSRESQALARESNSSSRRTQGSKLRGSHSRSRDTRHRAFYEDPSSSEFGSDVSSRNHRTRPKKVKIEPSTAKRKGKPLHMDIRSDGTHMSCTI